MPSQGINLFVRIIKRNPKVYLLKIISLALAFASSTLVILFSINEFQYDNSHLNSENIFRVIKRNNLDDYNGNRYSTKIPSEKFRSLQVDHQNSVTATRVSILNGMRIKSREKSLPSEKIHAADSDLTSVFTFNVLEGSFSSFERDLHSAIISESLAQRLFGTTKIKGKQIDLISENGKLLAVKVAAVFADHPANSHETFNLLIRFDSVSLRTFGFTPSESNVYLRTDQEEVFSIEKTLNASSQNISYSLQPLTDIYFGRRMIGEETNHGDSYSILIMTCITAFILLLAVTNYVILATLTLPYRSKELAVKKLAGTSQAGLMAIFINESGAIVLVSFLLGLGALILSSGFVKP
jgi:putative ABC transport system permease protein